MKITSQSNTECFRRHRFHIESISDHIKKTGVLEADKKSIEKASSELVKLNLIMNKKTPQGMYSLYRTSRNEILTCEMENLPTKENPSNNLTIREEINSKVDENFFFFRINKQPKFSYKWSSKYQ